MQHCYFFKRNTRVMVHRSSEAGSLVCLGDIHHARGSLAAARKAWQDALAILDDLDHPEAAVVRES